jgi:hypothetical protein
VARLSSKVNTVKNLQTETTQPSKQRGYQYWILRVVILLGLLLLFYYGYCWGLWGRHSLLMQYLFQCSCPPASEEARYPEQIDVIVTACQHISSRLSPSGRLLFVSEKKNGSTTDYLLNLQTMQETYVTNLPYPSFLTDDLWFVESGLEDNIIDRTTGRQYPIQPFVNWQEDAYINGEPNLELLVRALRQAEHIFFTQRNNDTVVVLMSNFLTNPDQSFTFNRSNIPSGNFNNGVEQFLQENNITYQTIPEDFRDESVSPDGKFVARADGIYVIETDQKIVDSYSIGGFFHPFSGKYFEVRGWTYDSSSAIYSKFLNPCLMEMGMLDGVGCFYEVPQPVIKLKVPREYLLTAKTPCCDK